MKQLLESTQALGRALMLPIAVLPVAGLMLRLGQPDLLDIAFIAAAGGAIFANLGLIFGIGWRSGSRGEPRRCGLAGAVGFVITKGAEVLVALPAAGATKQIGRLSVPIGIAAGITAGWLYNRYSKHQTARLSCVLRRQAASLPIAAVARRSCSRSWSATDGRPCLPAWMRSRAAWWPRANSGSSSTGCSTAC
jgi:phosphotransferase system  glucose/maltose/N-acetylglucosamine-specific IIC component